MARFLFFNVPTSGHVDPTLPFAAELVGRGHEVTYFLTEEYRARVEATGAAFTPYQGLGPDYFEAVASRFNPLRLATQLVETAAGLMSALGEAIARIRPQAIVYDSMCPWGRIAAQRAGLPAVASMALLDLPPRYLIKSGEWLSAPPIILRGLPWLPRYLRAARGLRRTTGVKVPSFIQLLNWPGDHNICYTAHRLMPGASNDEIDYTFVGPPVMDVAAEVPFPYEELAPDRPLVYVSLGTVFNNNPGFFRACLAAFAGSEAQVVVSTGRGLNPGDLAPLPDNAIVRDYVPQQAILRRASLYISHSGANSVHQALYHGVPLLLVPQQLEQALIAGRVAELGAGLILNRRRVSQERVSRLAQRLLSENSFRYQADALGAALRKAGGAARAADAIEGVVN